MDNIIKKLKDSNRYFWFIFKDGKFSLLAQSKSKTSAKEEILEKIKSHDIQKNIPLIYAYIQIQKKNSFSEEPIAIVIQFKRISKGKIKSVKENDRSGVVNFTKDYILKNGFKSEYLLNILEGLFFDRIKLDILGNNLYEDLNIA